MTDDEFAEIWRDCGEILNVRIADIINNFVAEAIATGYDTDSIFADSTFEYECRGALQYFSFPFDKLDREKVKGILLKEHSLRVVSDSNPLDIEKVQQG